MFVEKPLALNVSEAEELKAVSEKNGRILMVGHLLQYHSAFIRLKELVRSGELGRIHYIYSNRLSFGKIRREEDIMWSFAPHDISMILTLAQEAPEYVMATGGNYLHKKIADVTTTHLEFPSGLKAHVFVSWLHPFKEQTLVVVAERNMAVFRDTAPWGRSSCSTRTTSSGTTGCPCRTRRRRSGWRWSRASRSRPSARTSFRAWPRGRRRSLTPARASRCSRS